MGMKKTFTAFILLAFLANNAEPSDEALIPAGEFLMGTDQGTPAERPIHKVELGGFFLDRFEVSNQNYEAFDPGFHRSSASSCDRCPATRVSWYEAQAYCQSLNRRLPSEAEWEKAARGNDGRLWPWGRKFDKGFNFFFVNIFGENDNYPYTAPVNYYHSGVSPFGLYNTAGNVWEWCLDWYDKNYYRVSPEINPEGPQGPLKMKVLRGGSWINSIEGIKVVKRARNFPHIKNEIYGFRTALSSQ